MPAGPMPLGFLYFAGAKLAGYSGYSKLFLDELDANEEGNSKKPSAFLVGLARTALGIAVGAAFRPFILLAQPSYLRGFGRVGLLAGCVLLRAYSGPVSGVESHFRLASTKVRLASHS